MCTLYYCYKGICILSFIGNESARGPLVIVDIIVDNGYYCIFRNCIGQNFAVNEEKVAIAKILRRLALCIWYLSMI